MAVRTGALEAEAEAAEFALPADQLALLPQPAATRASAPTSMPVRTNDLIPGRSVSGTRLPLRLRQNARHPASDELVGFQGWQGRGQHRVVFHLVRNASVDR